MKEANISLEYGQHHGLNRSLTNIMEEEVSSIRPDDDRSSFCSFKDFVFILTTFDSSLQLNSNKPRTFISTSIIYRNYE